MHFSVSDPNKTDKILSGNIYFEEQHAECIVTEFMQVIYSSISFVRHEVTITVKNPYAF